MKAVMLSIRPKWVEKIASGEKTVEVRKTAPKLEVPFKVYMYCTYGNERENYCLGKRGKVVGEFVCDKISEAPTSFISPETVNIAIGARMREKDLCEYGKGKNIYGWHISDLKIYDKPKDITDFGKIKVIREGTMWFGNRYECNHIFKEPITRPPQSWCYVE